MSGNARVLVYAVAALLCASPLAAAEQTLAKASGGTAEQRAWVRSAATRFVNAELAGDGASACGILVSQLRATVRGRSCAERWDARLATLLRRPGSRTTLRGELREIPRAAVLINGDAARINLRDPLLRGSSRFLWTENCWMLRG